MSSREKNEKDQEWIDPGFVQEDPWEKLSKPERKKAERNLYILYAVMTLLVILPFVMFFVFRKS